MRTAVLVLAAVALIAVPRSSDAQTAYARSAKDTLRFHEVSHTEVRVTTPQGEMVVPVDHEAKISVMVLPGDSARAWYDSLRVSASSPAGLMAPDLGSVLRQPFALKLDSRGRTSVVSAPAFPQALQGLTDLAHQFDDFFLRLPAQPLKVGLMWTDTSSRTDSTGGKWVEARSIAQYKVERDTTINGEAALVVSMKQQQTVSGEGPVPGQDARMQSKLSGGDDGIVIFSPRSGRMLGRQRKGELRGETVLSAQGQSMTMGQTMTFTSRIDALR